MKEKQKKNRLTVLWYSHTRLSIALLLIVVNLAVILLFTGILSIISGNNFFAELAYIFAFTMSADGIYDFVNSNEDLISFIIKVVLVVVQMIIFSGALIGFTTNILQSTMDKTLNNVGKIKLEDHYVFLNWSSIGPRIIYDLSFLEGEKNIVILADKEREDILNSIQNVFMENKRKMKNIKVFVKQGSPMSSKHLNDVSLDKAKYIGVLIAGLENSGEYQMTANDLNAIKTLFTMVNVGVKANIVLEAEENSTLEKIEGLLDRIDPELNKRILVFSHNSVVGHIMGRAIVNPTFNDVYHELLSYEGVEFYGIPTKDIEEALYTYNDCIPIINYDDDDYVGESGKKEADQLYVLSDNSQNLGERIEKKVFVKSICYKEDLQKESFSVFILSKSGEDEFVKDELEKYAKISNIAVDYYSYTYSDDLDVIKEKINKTKGQKKVLLLSSSNNDEAVQDAEVFLTAMDLKMGGVDEDVQIYAEIFNPSNTQALQNIGVVSVIVSNKIISLFMVQLLTHPRSKKFYRDLISVNDTEGDDALDLDIVKAREVLVFNEESIRFSCQSELVQSFYIASNKTKMCIGVKHEGKNEKVRFLCDRMDKPENLIIYPDDELILITY